MERKSGRRRWDTKKGKKRVDGCEREHERREARGLESLLKSDDACKLPHDDCPIPLLLKASHISIKGVRSSKNASKLYDLLCFFVFGIRYLRRDVLPNLTPIRICLSFATRTFMSSTHPALTTPNLLPTSSHRLLVINLVASSQLPPRRLAPCSRSCKTGIGSRPLCRRVWRNMIKRLFGEWKVEGSCPLRLDGWNPSPRRVARKGSTLSLRCVVARSDRAEVR